MAKRASTAKAWARLYLLLDEQSSEGRWPACANPGLRQLWLSDVKTERAEAALWCVGCLILEQCAAAAEASNERFGVWGGVDRTAADSRQRHQEPADREDVSS